ncbi:reverse transcriptase domain-containing protein [Tanacetum coccineum]
MTSLADKSLLSGGDNKPPMLEKHLYDSWKSRMDVIDIACEEYVQKLLKLLKVQITTLLQTYDRSPLSISHIPSRNPWVSPVHCVPKKGGITVVKNEDNELIPTRSPIDPLDQEKNPFTSLKTGTFAYRPHCLWVMQMHRANGSKVAPDWDLPFEIMCDASDFAVGAVLGQRKAKHFQPIHYASKTMTEAQEHITPATEKELLAAFDCLKLATMEPTGGPYGANYTAGDHRKIQLNELNELRDHAYENSLIYKEKTKRIHDSKIKNRVFNVGDRVLLFNSRLKIFSGKLKTRWSGPFTVTQVFPYGTVELSQNSGPNFKVNGHRLKHYFGGDIPTEVVPDLQTFPMDQ